MFGLHLLNSYPGYTGASKIEMKGKSGRRKGRRKKNVSFFIFFFLLFHYLALVPGVAQVDFAPSRNIRIDEIKCYCPILSSTLLEISFARVILILASFSEITNISVACTYDYDSFMIT